MTTETIRVPIKGKHRDEVHRVLGLMEACAKLDAADAAARNLPGWNYAFALLDAAVAEARQRAIMLGYKAAAKHGVDLRAYEIRTVTADYVEWRPMDLADLAGEG